MKPNRAEVPFYSSTPAVKSEDTAEGSKGCFSFSDPIPEEIKVSDDDGSLSEDEYEEEEPLQEKELEHLDAVHKASASGPGPSPKHSDTTSSAKGSFSLGNSLDEAVLKKPPNPVRMTAAAAESSHAKSIPQPTVVGAFSAVDKSVGGGIMPPSSQPTKVEPALAPSGLSLPATKAEVKCSLFDVYAVLIQEKEISVILYQSHDIIEMQKKLNLLCIQYLSSIHSLCFSISQIKHGDLSMPNLIYQG